ncbi:phosphatase PAP2 family protein [Glycomyces sp. TRM65418]|uniref:phosphatase PAP2 family protein n=1 Tax=Glycomyces sp. TRM65418 TaxID=2867006 RepID=UPI001CE57502|nr:phosphatase PAP2 family protein [Glycomyces sp. TRM65418]MCC3761907.1 phosphatase PAP2 family protein [Glycomyces sp. TRM65418]QZD55988.1 phosphatase PAP2 family protein [Glycomyces sp. TRM65418]
MTPNGFPKSRLALILAIAIPLGVLGDALWIRADPDAPPWQDVDDWWNGLVGGPAEGPAWQAAELFYHVGAQSGLLVLAAAAVALLLMRRWRSAVFACAAVAVTALVVDLLKTLSARPRPADIMVETASLAFPSGHAARMAAFVVVIAAVAIPARHLKFWWPIGAVLTIAMMLARNWQHAHWLTDTIAGAALGWAVAALTWWAMTPLLDRERAARAAAEHARTAAGHRA